MISYLLRRFVSAIIVILGIMFVTFTMLHIISPSPARAVLGIKASPQAIAGFNREHGYDNSFLHQFVTYLNQTIHGNLGYSYKLNQSVTNLFKENTGRSALLSGVSVALAVLIAIPLGILQAVKRNSFLDYSLTAVSFTLYSMPIFFISLLLIDVFALQLHVFPFEASQSTTVIGVLKDPRSMVLPVTTLVALSVAGYSRYMRSSALDNLAQDYIKVARAKGLPERAVLFRHLVRNSSLPMVTLIGLSIPDLLAGNLITEQVFNYPGLGLLFYNSLGTEDYPILLAYTLVGGILVVFGNFIADVALTLTDHGSGSHERRDVMVMMPPGGPMGGGPLQVGSGLTIISGQATDGGEVYEQGSGFKLTLKAFAENKLALVGIAVVLFFLAFSFLGPHLYHSNQLSGDLGSADLPPGKGHPFGTDDNGFDVLGRMMKGGQSSLEIGLLTAVIATVVSTIYGAIAGLIGGVIDGFMMRIVDVGLSIPTFLIILIISARYGATVLSLSIVIGLNAWFVPARLVRGEVLTVRTRDFVAAARSMGSTQRRQVFRHLIPNALSVVIVNITFQVADAILIISVLGYLNFGLNYPQIDWGDELSSGVSYLQDGYWWLIYPVGICLILTVMAFNFIGDALRDAVDVRMRKR